MAKLGSSIVNLALKRNSFFTHQIFTTKCLCANHSTVSRSTENINNAMKPQLDSIEIGIAAYDTNSVGLKLSNDTSVLAPCTEDVSDFAPYVKPSFNFAAYINDSHTLQELIKLNVNLYKIEGMKGAPEVILKLNFEEDVKPYIRFLHDVGVEADNLGEVITKNPMIFTEDLDNLAIRVNYLKSKKFTFDNIARIVTRHPRWLTFRAASIDEHLGYIQRRFDLTGNEVRLLAVKMPKLITSYMQDIEVATFAIKEEMGFTPEETKSLLLQKPKLFLLDRKELVSRIDYIHNTMKISHELMTKMPQVLLSRESRTRERHCFLLALGRAQYDPTKPGYVSLKSFVSGSDTEFCRDVAKASVQSYNVFLKSL